MTDGVKLHHPEPIERVDETHAPIPSLLAVSAVHHHLISVQKRVQTALVVETGEMREVMHAALLLGYGASAINPYMSFAILQDLVDKQEIQLNYETARKNYIKALCKGLLKVLSKMGISTIRSYRGAKLFEAIGLSQELVDTYFGGTASHIGGIRLQEVAADALALHREAFSKPVDPLMLEHKGLYSYTQRGRTSCVEPGNHRHASAGNPHRRLPEVQAILAPGRREGGAYLPPRLPDLQEGATRPHLSRSNLPVKS